MEQRFEPKIIAFLCNWCSYAGADLAGISRFQYPPNILTIRVMCSGAVAPEFIVKAFLLGAGGVLVAGCHPGDCHYQIGNYYANRRFNLLTRFLEIIGIPKERVRLEWISAAEGVKFAQVARDFVGKIKQLGPLSLKTPPGFDGQSLARMVGTVGSAGKLFWEEDRCMADMVQFFIDYTQKDSCAECVPCRIGTKRMQEIVQKIFDGSISDSEIALLRDFSSYIGASSKCDRGKMAGKAVKYALEFCKQDIDVHIKGNCAHSIPANPGWQTIVL